VALRVFVLLQMVGTLSLGPHSEVHDVWQNLEDIGYCFELKTVAGNGDVKKNVFMVRCLSSVYTLQLNWFSDLEKLLACHSADNAYSMRMFMANRHCNRT